jgi:hypothetical protein
VVTARALVAAAGDRFLNGGLEVSAVPFAGRIDDRLEELGPFPEVILK